MSTVVPVHVYCALKPRDVPEITSLIIIFIAPTRDGEFILSLCETDPISYIPGTESNQIRDVEIRSEMQSGAMH